MREWLHLKHVLRTGWVRAGVESPESVAAHSWGMSILAM
ncbi:MAG: HD domain-containing protein, partial [Euryarchaeota archaeon]|nr:HD domain-containing protein [Euryarchaeota archaeon]